MSRRWYWPVYQVGTGTLRLFGLAVQSWGQPDNRMIDVHQQAGLTIWDVVTRPASEMSVNPWESLGLTELAAV